MKKVSILVEDLSKKYCKSLKRSMLYGMSDIGHNALGLSSRPQRLRHQEFWAVDDVSFSIEEGETLGVIGHNGAGKTTLLKLLNGIFWPDRGKIRIWGRVGALIEVGAGFHPLLTGRENIYLNGAILGMSEKEIRAKFDTIVDFAGVGDFIDTPVKCYSSGMFVRLGFAVAAHCDPHILLVDEVLAVGDMSFQSKCRERIRELKKKGTTIVLVSHSLYTVNFVCGRTLVMGKGKKVFDGPTSDAIDFYRSAMAQENPVACRGTGELTIKEIRLLDGVSSSCQELATGDPLCVRIHYEAEKAIDAAVFNVGIHQVGGGQVSDIRNDLDGVTMGARAGKGHVDVVIDNCNLFPGVYTVNTTLFHADGFSIYDRVERAASFRVMGGHNVNGSTFLPHVWNQQDVG